MGGKGLNAVRQNEAWDTRPWQIRRRWEWGLSGRGFGL
jgi:hypothetical protein